MKKTFVWLDRCLIDTHLHEESEPSLGPMLHVGLPVEEQGLHLVPALEIGQGQRRVPVGLDLRVDVGAHVEQELDGSGVTILGGQHEGQDAQLGSVDLRAL